MAERTHLDHVRVTQLPESVDGCEDCLRDGGKWLHLRICLECGHVGCCDDSPSKHATQHAARRSTRSSVARAGRELVLVLPGRAAHADRRRRGPDAHPALADAGG